MCRQVSYLLLCLQYTLSIPKLYRNFIIKRLNSASKLTTKSDRIDQPQLCVSNSKASMSVCFCNENQPVNEPRTNHAHNYS